MGGVCRSVCRAATRLRGIEQWEMIGQKACKLSEVDCGWRSGYAESDLLVRLF